MHTQFYVHGLVGLSINCYVLAAGVLVRLSWGIRAKVTDNDNTIIILVVGGVGEPQEQSL
jgi:hypothetical protein